MYVKRRRVTEAHSPSRDDDDVAPDKPDCRWNLIRPVVTSVHTFFFVLFFFVMTNEDDVGPSRREPEVPMLGAATPPSLRPCVYPSRPPPPLFFPASRPWRDTDGPARGISSRRRDEDRSNSRRRRRDAIARAFAAPRRRSSLLLYTPYSSGEDWFVVWSGERGGRELLRRHRKAMRACER